MVAMSDELRNLLTEESLNSIVNAGNIANGHLSPKEEVNTNININGENNLIHENLSKKISNDCETNVDYSELKKELQEIKQALNNRTKNYDNRMNVFSAKINDLVKAFNSIEQKVFDLDKKIDNIKVNLCSNPNVSVNPEQVQQQNEVKAIPTQADYNKEKQSVGRGRGNNLPPELSMESVFNCNGKKF